MARRFWPEEDPIGRQVHFPGFDWTATVVGVVGDVKHRRLDEDLRHQVYTAFAQRPNIFATLVVRTAGDPLEMVDQVRDAVWSVDKDQPVWKIRTLQFLIDRSVFQQVLVTGLLGTFALIALLLAAMGIYGVISYTVSQRSREMGIRIALGAQRGDVFRLVVGQGLKLALIGVGIGILGALALTRLISSLLYEVNPTDPVTFVVVSLLLTAVALLACYIPARRATKVDPMVALRYE